MTKKIERYKIEEEIALLLLKLDNEEEIETAIHWAHDMAVRIFKARLDPSWGEIWGRPALNKRLKSIARKDRARR